jgi:hypothetical protein
MHVTPRGLSVTRDKAYHGPRITTGARPALLSRQVASVPPPSRRTTGAAPGGKRVASGRDAERRAEDGRVPPRGRVGAGGPQPATSIRGTRRARLRRRGEDRDEGYSAAWAGPRPAARVRRPVQRLHLRAGPGRGILARPESSRGQPKRRRQQRARPPFLAAPAPAGSGRTGRLQAAPAAPHAARRTPRARDWPHGAAPARPR